MSIVKRSCNDMWKNGTVYMQWCGSREKHVRRRRSTARVGVVTESVYRPRTRKERRSIACARARDDTAFDARWMTRQVAKSTVNEMLESEVALGKWTHSGHMC